MTRKTTHTRGAGKAFLLKAVMGAGLALSSSAAALADHVADFYRGRTVNILIGSGAGGEYDLQARLVGRYLGRYIPGNPVVVSQNMTGASGIRMANHLYVRAVRDGTVIGMIGNNFPSIQAAEIEGVQFDAGKFLWLGSIAPVIETMAVLTSTGASTIDDLRNKEVIAGASARGAIAFIFPAMMNEYLGTKFKIVSGYQSGNEINIAMERGEVSARNNTWSSWKTTKPDWIAKGTLKIVAMAGSRVPDLDAPSIESLTKDPADRQLVEFITSGTRLGRPLATTPDVPEDRLKGLRAAFMSATADPDFRTDAKRIGLDVEPVSGEALQEEVRKILSTPRAIALRAKELLE